MKKRAVLFDMDGTLVDSEGLHQASLLNAVTSFGYEMDPKLADEITGTSGRDTHAILADKLGFKPTFMEYIEAKYRHYLERAKELGMRPGAVAVLDGLKEAGVPFAVVSNSDRMLVDANLNAVGLQFPGLVTVSRNDVRQGKPHAEPYLRGAYLLGVAPADCIVVEDSLPGAVAGHAAGMTVIGWPEAHRAVGFPSGTVTAASDDLWTTLSALLGDADK